jgi:hypothetical protein
VGKGFEAIPSPKPPPRFAERGLKNIILTYTFLRGKR